MTPSTLSRPLEARWDHSHQICPRIGGSPTLPQKLLKSRTRVTLFTGSTASPSNTILPITLSSKVASVLHPLGCMFLLSHGSSWGIDPKCWGFYRHSNWPRYFKHESYAQPTLGLSPRNFPPEKLSPAWGPLHLERACARKLSS